MKKNTLLYLCLRSNYSKTFLSCCVLALQCLECGVKLELLFKKEKTLDYNLFQSLMFLDLCKGLSPLQKTENNQ